MTKEGEKALRDYLLIGSNKQITKKEKIIFDSNIFDDMVEGRLNQNRVVYYKESKNADFYITHIQVDEINECSDKEKRAKLFLFMGKIRPIIIPTSSFVLGTSRLGEARLGDGMILEELRQGNIKHTGGALIGETAIKEGLTLITNDNTLKNRVNNVGGKALSLGEFDNIINNKTSNES